MGTTSDGGGKSYGYWRWSSTLQDYTEQSKDEKEQGWHKTENYLGLMRKKVARLRGINKSQQSVSEKQAKFFNSKNSC